MIKTMKHKYLIGGLSGGIAQLIASPCDLLKIRYITNLKTQKNIMDKLISYRWRANGV